MIKRVLFASAFLAVAAAPLAAQQGPQSRISAEPYVGYGFFGSLPGTSAELQGTVAYGGRLGYQLTPQWGVYGNFQRANPELQGANITLPGVTVQQGRNTQVDRWSAGVEFSYVPRGGAEGMLPLQLEAGLAQTRYEWGVNDLGIKVGASSALQLSRNLAVRYGVDDYITNYRNGEGVVNQFTARIGAELRF
jgi:hypothetical protein